MVAVASMLFIMALGARRFSGEEFGFWVICVAGINFGMVMDFGFRYGLGNRIAALSANAGSDEVQRETYWSIFYLETLIGGVGFVLCLSVLPWFDWIGLFKIQSVSLASTIHWLFPLVCAVVMLNQPLTIASTVFFARQDIMFASFLSVMQACILTLGFWLAMKSGNLILVVLSYLALYSLCGLGVTLILVQRCGLKWLLIPWRRQKDIIQSFWKPSRDFFVLSLVAAISGVMGPVIAGAVGGLSAGGNFSLIQRIFSLLVTMHLAVLSPLSPAYTYHARLGDWNWIVSKLRRCSKLYWPLFFLVGGLVIWIGHPLILRVWTGKWMCDYVLAGLLAIWGILCGWGNTYSVLLNSLGVVRIQAVLAIIMLIPAVGLPILAGRLLGVYGVALASVICAVPGAVLCVVWVRVALKRRCLYV